MMMRKGIPAILLLGMMFIPLAHSCSADSVIKNDKAGIVIGNNNFKYEIEGDGRNLCFMDKATGLDYFYADSVSHCAYVMQNGIKYHSTSLSFNNDLLKSNLAAQE
ncbi:MAG: hypothetical protein WCS03_15585 [Bacteroidota bacterium]